ncbi:Ig-like domain-containing protein [uncultured Roseobacter sp.]|uniref:RCC1 domain-containing protein n=1 Tax=uncultured Roseobacter sp. TaxID=114847 RepID=UPI002604F7DB|nr:Ig-like domain-containing protein [uncultured Roseobacter sp.]
MGRVNTRGVEGILLGDQRLDQLLLLQDSDGDGTAEGEATVFFDASNASGIETPTNNIFAVTQIADGSVMIGDGTADAVFRLTDLNRDGDAQDAGEAVVWFSSENAAGFSTVTPNGVAEGGDGAIYIANAGTSSVPQDAIYRTQDINGDGDANDAGEATVWLDVTILTDTPVPFDLNFFGDVAYLTDLVGGGTDTLWRIEDTDGDGAISADEARAFISDDMSFGAPVDIAHTVAADGSIYTSTWIEDGGFKVYRLTDVDGSGQIDQQFEAIEVWNDKAMVGESLAEIGFSLAAGPDGTLFVTANSFAGDSTVLALENLNGDGDFLDAGETTLFASSAYDGQLVRARAVEAYQGEPAPVLSSLGAGNHFSIFLQDGVLYSSGENIVAQLGNGAIGFDVKAPRPVEMPDGVAEGIVSVSAGLLHSTFLTEDGDVWAFGFNNRGPLGLGDEEPRTEAVKIAALDNVTIVAIENGNGFSFAVAADGTLYGWGNNSNGQLGLGDQDERLSPVVVEAFAGQKVVAVAADVSHTLVLTDDGAVYAMGSNVDNQVSREEDRRVLEPVLVADLPDDIVGVSTAGRTSYAVTADGRVFGWGQSDEGQLLQGTDNGDGTFTSDEADVPVPVELTALPEGIIDVQGGARWAVALTSDGDVYAWGPNDEGPTGGLDGDPTLESDVSFYPTKIAELDDVNVVEIETGPNSILAVTSDGRVFGWGSNSDGRLGFASDGPLYTPVEIDLTADAPLWLVSATPADNAGDVETDAALTLTFTEEVTLGKGAVTLVNRDTGERIEIDVTDPRLVQVDGAEVTVTPPEHLAQDSRYAIEIEPGAFVDSAGQAYAGIAEGDTSTFNFGTADEATGDDVRTLGTMSGELLRAGAGDDRLFAFAGDDIVSGGAGDDILHGHYGDDRLLGGDGDDQLLGGYGDDTMLGGAGDDQLYASYGDDTLSGEEGNDILYGGRGDDTLSGGDGNDQMFGGFGADRLEGGSGNDMLSGGLGADVFVFGIGHDVITDFDGDGEQADLIEIAVAGIGDFVSLAASAIEVDGSVRFIFDENTSLALREVSIAELEAEMFAFV